MITHRKRAIKSKKSLIGAVISINCDTSDTSSKSDENQAALYSNML